MRILWRTIQNVWAKFFVCGVFFSTLCKLLVASLLSKFLIYIVYYLFRTVAVQQTHQDVDFTICYENKKTYLQKKTISRWIRSHIVYQNCQFVLFYYNHWSEMETHTGALHRVELSEVEPGPVTNVLEETRGAAVFIWMWSKVLPFLCSRAAQSVRKTNWLSGVYPNVKRCCPCHKSACQANVKWCSVRIWQKPEMGCVC